MKINRHNYEAFLLDQLEGNLSEEEQQQLEQFLLLNPDCAGELSELEPWVLEGQKLPFKKPELLKKVFPDAASVLHDHNFDLFSIARMEGDLGEEQILAHQAMLEADAKKAKHWAQWQQTRLVAEPVIFPGKDRLSRKKPFNRRILWIPLTASAAAAALLLVLLSRMPELPRQEGYSQAQEEFTPGAIQESPVEAGVQAEEAEPVSDRIPAEQSETPDLIRREAVVHPEQTEPVPAPEALTAAEPETRTAILPRSLAISAGKFKHSSMISEVRPDKIEALSFEPVTVPAGSLTMAQISEKGLQEIIEEYAEEKELSLWKIARAGINGINKIAGSDISLMASRDEEGEVSGFQLKSKRFSLSRPLNREE
jgi:hypothetical protein